MFRRIRWVYKPQPSRIKFNMADTWLKSVNFSDSFVSHVQLFYREVEFTREFTV